MKLSGWGNYPLLETQLLPVSSPRDLLPLLQRQGPVLARGAGRAYGDAGLGTDRTLAMAGMDRFLAFDPESGILTAEAGMMLSDIIAVLLPRGFFPPVVPGTQFVTLGGMVAANVHGKNHHIAGGFGRHVIGLKIALSDGSVVSCDRHQNESLFRMSLGGMGLTGIITEVTFRMMPVESAFIRQETLVAPNLDAAMACFENSLDWSYSVAWIDGLAKGAALGRSLVYRGEHALRAELSSEQAQNPYGAPRSYNRSVPFFLPEVSLNRFSVEAFNALYYRLGASSRARRITSCFSYFFPLDSVGHWNRIYGRRGLIQHQCVIPKARSREALGEMLERISAAGNPSFLAVLKLLGRDEDGVIGFPLEGYTLSIDFPADPQSFLLARTLDAIVAANGGRIYLAKDACQDRVVLEAGYPNLDQFRNWRQESGSARKFRSLQSERLGL